MKTLNLKEFFGSTVLAFNPDGRTTVKRRSNDGHIRRHLPVGLTKLLSLFFLLTLGTGQIWGSSGTITVYFKNTPGWTNVYVYFYSGAYWDNSNGSGSASGGSFQSGPNKMTYDSTLKLYKYTYTGTYSGVVSFTKDSQSNYGNFYNTEAAYRGDYSTSSPIYVPSSTSNETKNGTKYYNTGQWVKTTKRTLYFVNKDSWATPKVYIWNTYSDHVSWSGETMTSTGQTYGGKTIYKYTTQYDFANVKFSNNGSSETGNLTLGSTNDGRMYNNGSWIAAQYDIDFDEEGATSSGSYPSYATLGSTMPTITTAPSKTGYTFGGYYDGDNGTGTQYWYANRTGAKTCAIDGPNQFYARWTAKQTTVTLTKNAPDGQTVSGATSITATYDAALPDFTALTCTGGYALKGYYTDASGGTKIINADGSFAANSGIWNRTDGATLILYAQWSLDRTLTYDGNGATSGSVPASATSYANGTNVTVLGNTGSFAKTGYSFAGWNTAEDGSGTPYAAGSTITMSANYTLYAQWTENKRTVAISVSPSGAGTLDKTSASVGVATTTTVTATAQPGYRFTGWTATNCSVEPSSSASTTLSGNGTTGDATLVANFARTYAFIEGRFQVKNAARTTTTYTGTSGNTYWSTDSRNIEFEYDETNHRFFLHTHMQPKELAAQLSSNTQYFKIQTSTSEASLTGGSLYTPASTSPDSNQKLSASGSANKKATSTTANRNDSFWFTSSDNSGYAILYFDEAGVWYELEHSLNYNANGGTGSAPATAYYLKGTNAPAASNPFTARTNYTFAGWNTDQYITGTSYAEGSDVPMNTNRMLYAKWDRTVTLEQEGATTEGSTTVIGTWNCATLPAITNPEKIGYTFGGWYTEVAGAGNLIIDTDGVLQADKTNWTDASGRFQRTPSVPASESKPLYAKWTQTVTLNANLANHGSGDNTSAIIVYKATGKTSITHCTAATGYHLVGYYTAATDGTKVLNADGSFAAATVTDYITDSKWTKAGATTLYAHYEPNTYDVILDVNGVTTGSNQTVVATFDAAMPTIQKTSGAAITAPSKTGYAFGGYWTNAAGTGTQYYTSGLASNHVWDVATNNTKIYAKWTPNNYTVTLNINEANHGTIAGKATAASVTFDATPTAIATGQLPTAAQGYAFMGFFSAPNGKGSQFINADGTWVTTVTDTISDGKWVSPAIATLYAYYKKAEITDLTLSASTVAPSSTFTVTPTISPDPTGTTDVCWTVLYAANDNELATQPAISTEGTTATITAPATPGTYKVQAILHNTDCNGTELSRLTATFVVAGDHTVTVRYIGDGEQLQASTQLQANQLSWSGDITAPTVSGYTFAGWTAGEGITITGDDGDTEGTSSSNATIKVKATYAGTLTANYVETPTVYFYNNLGWSDVYVTYDAYWTETSTGDGEGTGNWGKPYHKMTRIEGTDIWYDEIPSTYTSGGFSGWAYNIAFNDQNQSNYSHFHGGNVIFRRDFDPYNTMFVPATKDVVTSYKKNNCDYYSSTLDYREGSYYYKGGYWKKYNKKYSGYSLRGEFKDIIGSEEEWSGEEHNLYSETTEETANGWETSTSLKLSGNHDYYFRIYRNHLKNDQSSGYTNNGTMTLSSHTDWRFETTDALRNTNCKISTATEGIYTFHVLFDKKGRIYVSVDYPMNVGDYRLLYKDDVHTTWHSSGTIASGNTEDIVSFFSRTSDKNPTIKWQYSTGIANNGTITWSTPADVSLTDWVGTDKVINDSAVYNFKVAYNAQSHTLALTDVKPYTGNYYIRTNSAGKYKWENYLNDPDHMMTYSEYAKTNGDYTHYWMAHVYANANVKFVIANDYSPCISDTLIQQTGDLSTTPAHVDATGNIHANANVRFMWDARNNKVKRAYLADAKEDGTEFLVLIAADDNAMKDANGNNLRQASASDAAGYNHGAPDHAVQFVDKENWIYEANVQLKPSAYVKLYANFDGGDFYYKGNSGSNFDGEEVDSKPNAIQLIGGDAGLQNVRVVYDFKTDRLMAAWLPGDAAITTETAINADVMIIRQHQDAGKQITFTGSGKLTDVKTVYGVMQFNRWTLNNKSTADGHAPLTGESSKSLYERALYFISFPFDVKVSEIFGFGKYWDEWYIEYYDGKSRAANGYWIDSEPNWKYVTPEMAKTFELKANQGYILGLDLDYMKDDNTTFWANDMQNVSLYFPSTTSVNNIQATSAVIPALTSDYYCEINRGTPDGDRRVKDSYWRCIGVPSYANYSNTLTDGANTIVWQTGSTLPYIYQWNMTDNTLTPQSTSNFAFLTMHAYLAQYEGAIHWSAVSATPSPVVARRTADETIQDREFRLELAQAQKMLDQTYVRLSMDEEVTTGFEFNHDLTKEINAGKANIYTYIGYEKAAANCLPMSNQTTIVPMGVQIAADGEYTFAMPEGTNGTGVTLIDNETGTRTSLALTDYTVTLAKGTYDNRFVLEFSPVAQTPTGIGEVPSDQVPSTKARKVLIDGIMYIVRDGEVFDARGTKVK